MIMSKLSAALRIATVEKYALLCYWTTELYEKLNVYKPTHTILSTLENITESLWNYEQSLTRSGLWELEIVLASADDV